MAMAMMLATLHISKDKDEQGNEVQIQAEPTSGASMCVYIYIPLKLHKLDHSVLNNICAKKKIDTRLRRRVRLPNVAMWKYDYFSVG